MYTNLLFIGMFFLLTATYLYTTDVGSTHTATTVNKEQQLSGGFVQLQRFTQQVRTKVKHQDGAVQDVLVIPLPHKLQLQAERSINMLAFRAQDKDKCISKGMRYQRQMEVIKQCGIPLTFLSGSESLRVQRMKSRREQICCSYWLKESLPLSIMTNGL